MLRSHVTTVNPLRSRMCGTIQAGGGPGQSLLFYVLYLLNRAFGVERHAAVYAGR